MAWLWRKKAITTRRCSLKSDAVSWGEIDVYKAADAVKLSLNCSLTCSANISLFDH